MAAKGNTGISKGKAGPTTSSRPAGMKNPSGGQAKMATGKAASGKKSMGGGRCK
jgi:hypothetical protein